MTFLFLKNSLENRENKTGFWPAPTICQSSILSLYGAFSSVSFLKGDKSRENENPGRRHETKSMPWEGMSGKANIWAGDGRTQGVGADAASE